MADRLITSTAILAELLGLSSRRIQQLVTAKILPVPGPKGHDLRIAVPAYLKFIQQPGKSANLADAKTKLTEVQTEIKRLELARLNGEVVATTDAAKIWETVATAIRSQFLALPTKLAPMVQAARTIPEVQQMLKKEITQVLSELSRLKLPGST